MPDGLERSYRRLLWAYPRFYRQRRGSEMLTTLLEAARPDQKRATRGEAANLLLSGLRLRLVPPGWIGKLSAGVVTLWAAVVLSGVGAYAAWSLDGVPPDDPAIATVSDSLVGRAADRVDFSNGDPLIMAYSYRNRGEFQTLAAEGWAGPQPAPTGQSRFYRARTTVAQAYQRLRADGWQTGVASRLDDCGCEVLWAQRDGVLLRFESAADQRAVTIRAYPAAPDGVPAAATAGLVVGLIVVWPLMTWLAHRIALAPLRRRLAIVLIGLPVLGACLANTVDTALSMAPEPDSAARMLTADFLYPLANQAANPLAAIVVGLGLAAVGAVLAPRSVRGAS